MFSMDFKGWHIWQNTQGRIIANGPDLENRLLDFSGIDDAVNWFFVAGLKPLARELHARFKAHNL